MVPFAKTITELPTGVRELVEGFRDGLPAGLGGNLSGAYLLGSIAFPEYSPAAGDIDFCVVTRHPLGKVETKTLDTLHRSLAKKFEFGRKLDGFYIPTAKARKPAKPNGLVYGAHGRIHRGGTDDAWPLHLEHFYGEAYVRLHGPNPRRIFRTADWSSIRSALYGQLQYARRIIDSDPWWSVLNLCRLAYSFEKGRVVISKIAAARWALKHLPRKWRPVITSAIQIYKGMGNRSDQAVLKRDAKDFRGFASVRIIAFDSTWDSRKPHIAQFRKSHRVAGRHV